MSGEELNRKYHELCGWGWYCSYGHAKCDCKSGRYWCNCPPRSCSHSMAADGHSHLSELPSLHIDANLAIAEARAKMTDFDQCGLVLTRTGAVIDVTFHGRRFQATSTRENAISDVCLKAMIAARSAQ